MGAKDKAVLKSSLRGQRWGQSPKEPGNITFYAIILLALLKYRGLSQNVVIVLFFAYFTGFFELLYCPLNVADCYSITAINGGEWGQRWGQKWGP